VALFIKLQPEIAPRKATVIADFMPRIQRHQQISEKMFTYFDKFLRGYQCIHSIGLPGFACHISRRQALELLNKKEAVVVINGPTNNNLDFMKDFTI